LPAFPGLKGREIEREKVREGLLTESVAAAAATTTCPGGGQASSQHVFLADDKRGHIKHWHRYRLDLLPLYSSQELDPTTIGATMN